MPLWPLSKVSHQWGLSPNLLYYAPSLENNPLARRQVSKSNTGHAGPKSSFSFTKTHLLPNVFPWIYLHFSCSQTLGCSILTHVMYQNAKYTHLLLFFIIFNKFQIFISISKFMSCFNMPKTLIFISFIKTHLLPNVFPWISLHFSSFQTLGYAILNSH